MSRDPWVNSAGDAAGHRPAGVGADAPTDFSGLLAALSAPAHPDELAAEEVVLVAFRSHHASQARPAAGRRSVPAALAKFLTVKVALASALAVAATGGMALAATTGALPEALGGERWAAPSRQHTAPRPSTPTDTPTTRSSPVSPHDLCRSYRSRTNGEGAATWDDPRFRTLVEAAGGREQVPGYCDALLAPGDGDGPSPPTADPHAPATGRPGHPTGKPTAPQGRPADPPGSSGRPGKPGKPGAGRPSASPTHQSGRPTTQPHKRS